MAVSVTEFLEKHIGKNREKREKQKTNMKERSDNCSGCSTP